MEDISRIIQGEGIIPDKTGPSTYERKKQKKRKYFQEAKKHLDVLTQVVAEIHKELTEKESPFRLNIYQEDDDVFIDIVTVDEKGNIDRIYKHDISHAELDELILHLKTGRGLILDANA